MTWPGSSAGSRAGRHAGPGRRWRSREVPWSPWTANGTRRRRLGARRLLPGPYCSLLLADLGAEVIKVETPLAGDYARMAPAELGFGGIFEAVNRGKRSIAVDYRRPRGRDLLLRLPGAGGGGPGARR